jgi:uncharacterized integral membrane protein
MGDRDSGGGSRRIDARAVIGVLVLVGLLAFVFQNTNRVGFNFLIFDFTAPLWLMLGVTVLLSMGLGFLLGRRSRRAD